MQDYTRLYRKSMHRAPQKSRGWCNPQAEAKHAQPGYLTRLNYVT